MGRVQGPAPRLIVFARNADGDIVRGSQSSFQKDRAQEHPPWGGCGFDERRRGSSIAFSLCSGRAPDTFKRVWVSKFELGGLDWRPDCLLGSTKPNWKTSQVLLRASTIVAR